MKIVFMGTPEFALQVLKKVYDSKHKVLAVVCATDKVSGRGKSLNMPPTKKFALENSIQVYQFENIKKEGVEILKNLNADIFVTAAYGQILSKEILTLAKHGTINVHGSLLPKYRGPSPVQYALLNGEKTTGVTIMQTDVGVDDGNVFLKKELKIQADDTTETLMIKLADLGGDTLVEVLNKIEANNIKSVRQDHTKATKTFMLKKEKSYINFDMTPQQIVNFIRAYFPNPVARFKYDNQDFKVLKGKIYEKNIEKDVKSDEKQYKNGEIVFASAKQGLVIACESGFIEIEILQAPSSKAMKAKDFLNGKKINTGIVL